MRTKVIAVLFLCLVACGDDDGAANNNVQPDAAGVCGDSEQDPGEVCDDGPANSDSNPDACRTDCRLPWCGDGVADTDEQCDQGAANSDTDPDACRTSCTAPQCGDAVVDSGEECEGDSGGVTCTDMGLNGGDQVVCDSACLLDPSGCAGCGNTICDVGQGETPQNCAVDCGPQAVSAGGNFTCALLGDGRVFCFGSNELGQLGSGVGTESNTPVEVVGLTDASAIATGREHACAILADGTVWCWGSNASGQLGDGTTTDSPTPVAVSGLSNAVPPLTAGGAHTCVRLDDGTAACWGENGLGQLGNGLRGDSSVPVAVNTLTDVIALTAGLNHTCATVPLAGGTTSPVLYCWGGNEHLQLGYSTGASDSRANPDVVLSLNLMSKMNDVSAGAYHTCGTWGTLLSMNQIHCWGDNSTGALGDGTMTTPPVGTGPAIPGLENIWGIATGGYATPAGINVWDYHGHTCARLGSGAVHCWGDNAYGQLGDSTTTDRLSPVSVTNLLNVVQLSAGDQHTCAFIDDHSLRCWGANDVGQLGIGNNLDSAIPVTVSF